MKNSSTLNFRLSLLALFICLFTSHNVISQENDIYELDLGVTNVQYKEKNGKSDRAIFNDLAFNMHTTHYIQNQKLKKLYGKGVVKKLTLEDINSTKFINEDLELNYNDVELITICLLNANDLNDHVDLLDKNQELNKLKYVFIKCNFDCNNEQIKKFIKVDSNVRVFYKIEKAS